MSAENWLEKYIQGIDDKITKLEEKMDGIDSKLDDLAKFKWTLMGGATLASAIIGIIVQLIIAKLH